MQAPHLEDEVEQTVVDDPKMLVIGKLPCELREPGVSERLARQAVERKVGARGLMMILEELLLDAMYTLPSQKRIKEFIITREMVERRRAVPGEGLSVPDDAAA